MTDEKVSHDAQIETGESWARRNDCVTVDTFQDLGVSAIKTSVFDRPDLRPWLTERVHEWDTIVWSKLDRAWRSMRDGLRFMDWAKANRKRVVFADDGLEFDYRGTGRRKRASDGMSEVFMLLLSLFAQIEGERFVGRALDKHSKLKITNRWSNGPAPYGFRTCACPTGGRMLEPDPDERKKLHEIAERLLSGPTSFESIVNWLNETGVKTKRSRPGKKTLWSTVSLIHILTSPATQGFRVEYRPVRTPEGEDVVHPNGKRKYENRPRMARDADGNPIRMASPTFDDDTWTQIQNAVAARQHARTRTNGTTNHARGVVFCDCGYGCTTTLMGGGGRPGTRRDGTPYKQKPHVLYIRCARSGQGKDNRCRNRTMKLEIFQNRFWDQFLTLYGDEKMHRKVFVPGHDNSAEHARVVQMIAELRADLADPTLSTTAEDRAAYRNSLRTLTAKRDALEAEGLTQPAGWVNVPTEWTWRAMVDTFAADDTEGIWGKLREAGVRVIIKDAKAAEIEIDVKAGILAAA